MFFESGDIRLHYQRLGEGDPQIVMLHGTTGWGQSFDLIAPHLAARHAVYLPDLRGHGRSMHIANAYRVVDFAEDIIALLASLFESPTIIWGHSLGGLVGIVVAAMRPDLVAALVVEDAPLWLRRFSVKEGSVRAYTHFLKLHQLLPQTQDEAELTDLLRIDAPEALRRDGESLAQRLVHLDPDVLRMSYDSSLMEQFDIDIALQQIECPTLIIQADPIAGGALPHEDAQAAVAQLPNGTLHVVPNAGHIIHREQPEQLAQLLQRFLQSNHGAWHERQ